MPIYEYHCQACSADFELLVRASTVPTCPHCSSTQLDKRVSLPAPQGTTAAIIRRGRAAAAKEGHFSNYSQAEKTRLTK